MTELAKGADAPEEEQNAAAEEGAPEGASEAPEAPAAPPEAAPEAAADGEDEELSLEGWRQRAKDLEEANARLEIREAKYTGRLGELNDDLRKSREENQELRKTAGPKARAEDFMSDPEVKEWMEQDPLAAQGMRKVLDRFLSASAGAPDDGRLDRVEGDVRRERFERDMDSMMPDWREVRESEGFRNWMQPRMPAAGEAPSREYQLAVSDNAVDAMALFAQFRREVQTGGGERVRPPSASRTARPTKGREAPPSGASQRPKNDRDEFRGMLDEMRKRREAGGH